MTRADPIDALREHSRGQTATRAGLAGLLVSVQVAVSLTLLIAAGLLIRTSVELAQQPVGATKDRVLIVTVIAPMTKYTLPQLVDVYERVRDAVAAVPGVERAALSDITPVGGSARTAMIDIPGAKALTERDRLSAVNVVSSGWLATYGMRVLAGRDIAPTDRLNTPAVALVNEAFVRRFLHGRNPIGQIVHTNSRPVEIVGMVEDTVYRDLRDPAPPILFTPTTQRPAARPDVDVSILTSSHSPVTVSRSVAAAIRDIDPGLVLQFRSLTEQVQAAMNQERIVALLSGFFGMLALLLAAIGLYGVTAYAVQRRRAEIGVRLALGADARDVIALVMGRVAVLLAVGTVAGTLLSLWSSQFVESLVWGLEPQDPATFAVATALLVLVGALAASLPTWRASRIDPAEVLR